MSKRIWCTTMPNPRRPDTGPDQGQRGWRRHLVIVGERTRETMIGRSKPETIDVSTALCGLVPAHGWGVDMFIEDECERCLRIAEKRGLEIPD